MKDLKSAGLSSAAEKMEAEVEKKTKRRGMSEYDKDLRYGPVVLRSESDSSLGTFYETRYKDGDYSCNCRGWANRRTCKHVEHCRSNDLTEPLAKAKEAAPKKVEKKRSEVYERKLAESIKKHKKVQKDPNVFDLEEALRNL